MNRIRPTNHSSSILANETVLSTLNFQLEPLQNSYIHRFVILRLLTEGGQSRVWTAVQSGLDTTVVLKQYDLSNDDKILKFKYELYLLKRLQEMRIPSIIHLQSSCYDSINRFGYMIFPYLDVPQHPDLMISQLSNQDLVRGMKRIAQTLQTIHQLGIIHGDIKPRNILWSRIEKQPYLIDFGSAQWMMPLMDRLIGTRPYKALELLKPNLQPIGSLHRSIDIWSLGVTYLCWISPRLRVAHEQSTLKTSLVASFFKQPTTWTAWMTLQSNELSTERLDLLIQLEGLFQTMLCKKASRRIKAREIVSYLTKLERRLAKQT